MTMKLMVSGALLAFLGACGTVDTTKDFGWDTGDLSDMKAGIWIDPNGCEHWIIDDGVEGYMTPRRGPDGIPSCRDIEELEGENTVGFEQKIIGDS